VRAIIKDDQVILVTRHTENRGGLEVTLYEVIGSDKPGKGARKRQLNMPIELTDMVQGFISALRAGDG
jgi:hypothetical protein